MEETCYSKLINAYKGKSNSGYIIFNKHKMRTTQLIKDIESFSLALTHLGFKAGDTLTLYLPTCPQSIVAFYACSKLGVIANIVHPLLPLEQLTKNLITTNSKGIMYYDILVKNQKKLEEAHQIMINCSVADYTFFRKIFYLIYARTKSKPSKMAINYKKLLRMYYLTRKKSKEQGVGESVVTSMHSGGTSGQPKIVKLSNNALNRLCDNLYEMYVKVNPVGKNEYGLVALPIFHAYGLGVSIHTCLCNHYNLILIPKFNAKQINNCIKRYNVTFMAGVPIMFKKMMEEKNFEGKHLAKLKDLWCGGDTVGENFVEHFDEKLKKYGARARLMRGYGLTEVCSVCAVNTHKDYKKLSCGKPMPNTTIEIWGADNEEVLEANQVGEIVVSTKCIMSGYEDGSGITTKDNKKWIRTGDLGYLDEDGFLFVIERKKRTVKIAAVNIFPSEIEEIARRHNLVKEACAVAYHYNDKTYIKVFVTLNSTDVKPSKISNEIKDLIKANLIKYAVPREVIVLDSMPMTPLGKIDYKRLEIM